MAMQLREGKVNWVQDLTGTTVSTAIPSSATAGVVAALVGGTSGQRVHFGLDMTVGGGTLSVTASLYGYTQTGTWTGWKFLGSLNSGSSITVNTSTWSPNTSQVTMAEVFSCSGENYERYASSVNVGGTSPVVSTYIGFPRE